jgi:hypothetical protein
MWYTKLPMAYLEACLASIFFGRMGCKLMKVLYMKYDKTCRTDYEIAYMENSPYVFGYSRLCYR